MIYAAFNEQRYVDFLRYNELDLASFSTEMEACYLWHGIEMTITCFVPIWVYLGNIGCIYIEGKVCAQHIF